MEVTCFFQESPTTSLSSECDGILMSLSYAAQLNTNIMDSQYPHTEAQSSLTREVIVKDIGFSLLSAGTSPESDIFLIHGIQGHPRNTWTYPNPHGKAPQKASSTSRLGKFGDTFKRSTKDKSQSSAVKSVYWPGDLLPKDFPNSRIFTYGYDSQVTHWFKGPAMQLDIFSYGESLLNGIEARRREAPDRPLIFIVHSLGGLVLKDALRRSRNSREERYHAVHLATKSIFFLGTPHRGGSYVNLGITAQKVLVCSGFDASDKVLRDLKFDSSLAKMLSEEFSSILDETRPLVYTFQEATGLSGFGPLSGKVVEDVSSALDYSRQVKDVIYSNHVDMCRFWGPDDDGYEKIKAALSHCLSGDSLATGQKHQHSFYQRVLESLYLPDCQERFNQVEEAYAGTFEWLFERKELGFEKWLQSGHGIFWISGKPASGKSTLLKYIASHPQTREILRKNNPGQPWVCGEFFFTNRGRSTQRSLDGLLQRILYQLLSQAPILLPVIEQLFRDHAGIQGEWILIYLEDALRRIVEQRTMRINICFFIDALDEHNEDYYENHTRLVRLLKQLVRSSDGKIVKIMLCVTSRPESAFLAGFSGCPGFPIHEQTEGDIQTYVNGRMWEYLNTRQDLTINRQTMDSISGTIGEIIRRAQGVFLWVKLVVTDFTEGLMDGDSPNTLREILDSIPGQGDLQELYGGILLRLRPKYLLEAFIMLYIAFAATEPMPIMTFYQAMRLTLWGINNYDWTVPSEQAMKDQLRSRCRGFLEIQASFSTDELGFEYQGAVVQFLHQSVKDFLLKSPSFDNIAKILVPNFPAYRGVLSENGHVFLLRFRVHEHILRYQGRPEYIKQRNRFDLRKFDILYHAYMIEILQRRTEMSLLDLIADFADANDLIPYYMRHSNFQTPASWEPIFLVLAVQAGLVIYVRYCLERRFNIHAWTGRPLLHYAVRPMPEALTRRKTDPFLKSGNMIRLLVRLGSNIEANFEGRTALGFLFSDYDDKKNTLADHMPTIEALLKLGADVDTLIPQSQLVTSTDPWGRKSHNFETIWMTPLQATVQKDDIEGAKLLLRYNANIAALNENDWTYLQKGYEYGDEVPYFEDQKDFPFESKRQQEEAWWERREKCIREGRNIKPMLRLVQQYQSGSRLAVPVIRRPASAQDLHPRYEYTEHSLSRIEQTPRIMPPEAASSLPRVSRRDVQWNISGPPGLSGDLRANREENNYLLEAPAGQSNGHSRSFTDSRLLETSCGESMRRSASAGRRVEGFDERATPIFHSPEPPPPIPPKTYTCYRPQDELFF